MLFRDYDELCHRRDVWGRPGGVPGADAGGEPGPDPGAAKEHYPADHYAQHGFLQFGASGAGGDCAVHCRSGQRRGGDGEEGLCICHDGGLRQRALFLPVSVGGGSVLFYHTES